MNPTFSLVTVTWNRAEIFKTSMNHSLQNTGIPWNEFIWVDNGSDKDQLDLMLSHLTDECLPSTVCLFKQNTGMHRGYNTAMSLARSDYVILFPPDILYPENWLATYLKYIQAIPHTGLISMYTVPIDSVSERYGEAREIQTSQGLSYIEGALPMELICVRRDVLSKIGYWREDFGLYGWADVEWAYRAMRVMNEMGVEYYLIPDQTGKHLGVEGSCEFKEGLESKEYHEWKQDQSRLSMNHDLMSKCRNENYPFYSPF